MEQSLTPILPIFLFLLCAIALAGGLLIVARLFQTKRAGRVTRMPYESGMDPIHDTRRRFDVRFHLLAIAFLIFDVELLFLYPWAVSFGGRNEQGAVLMEQGVAKPQAVSEAESPRIPLSPSPPLASRRVAFAGAMTFVALLTLGFIYDWRKGVFRWR